MRAATAFGRAAYRHGLEGLVSKRLDRRYLPDDRSAWAKTKCLNRGEFVIFGWSAPKGTRPFLGPSCWASMTMTAGCYMQDASARACPKRPSPSFTVASSR